MDIEQIYQKLRGLYNAYIDHYFKYIVDIFNDYYGEERVDLQYNFWDNFYNTILNGFYNPDTFEFTFDHLNNDSLIRMSNIYNESEENINHILNSIDFQNLYINHRYDSNCVYILVHFPQVKITNESGKSTNIKNLFAKITLTLKGEFKKLQFNKTHYTYAHFIHGYLHSHVPKQYRYSDFDSCCTGTGPINNTISMLNHYAEDNDYTDQWMQFCWDLDKYVTIESEEGIPYIRMKDCESEFLKGDEIILNLYESHRFLDNKIKFFLTLENLKLFIKYLIDNKAFKFKWSYKKWEYAHSNTDLILIISNYFIKWLKDFYIPHTSNSIGNIKDRFFNQVISVNNKLFIKSSITPPNIDVYQYKDMFIFKGEMQKLCIDEPINNNTGFIWILQTKYAQPILMYLLKIINIYYGKDTITETGNPLPIENF